MQEAGSVQATLTAEHTDPTLAGLPKKIVVIGASAGGPSALAQIIPKFPEFFPGALVIVQHMRPGFTKLLAQMLSMRSDIIVREAENHAPIYRGSALVAPGGSTCMVVRQEDRPARPIALRVGDRKAPEHKGLGLIDLAMVSAARAYGDKVIGVLLTGIGSDGREGMRVIKENKGFTIAQDGATCVISDAPRMIAEAGLADDVLPLWAIPDRILELVGE